jgi:prepilin-type N-terminal cleavage/methylation domain-containing protein
MKSGRTAFTLIELLTVIAIIAILAALLMPAINVVREKVRKSQAQSTVAALHQAMQGYAAEERRHRFPTAATDLSLGWSPPEMAGAGGTLNLLENQGFEFDRASLDRSVAAPYPLHDPWHRPYRYQVDGDLLGTSGAQRPLGCDGTTPPLEGWNAQGIRPWGYVWSLGSAAAADGTGWIYQHDGR